MSRRDTESTVLVVDDEPRLHRLVQMALEPAHFRVTGVRDPREALSEVARRAPAVVVMEMRQRLGDGVSLCRELRSLVGDVPVIFLATDAADETKVAALRCGDDYVTKPFSHTELLARVQALLRRARPSPLRDDVPDYDDGLLRIELEARTVVFGGVPVHLTPTEYALLEKLVVNRGRVLLQEDLMEHVWGSANAVDPHVLRLHVANLRRKVEPDPSQPRYVKTLRGLGYRFDAAER